MRSTTKLNSGILSLLQQMREKYPELLRNMDETPVALVVPAAMHTAQFELQHYYDTLRAIYCGYEQDYPHKTGALSPDCE